MIYAIRFPVTRRNQPMATRPSSISPRDQGAKLVCLDLQPNGKTQTPNREDIIKKHEKYENSRKEEK